MKGDQVIHRPVTAQRELDPDLKESLIRFGRLVDRLNRCYNVVLPCPSFETSKSLKEFCGGLLCPGKRNHLWWPIVSRLPIKKRVSISGSLFLVRKTFPCSVEPSLAEYAERMSRPGGRLPEGYVDFCRREVRKMFTTGWDSKYWKGKVMGCTVGCSSVREAPRRLGGGRSLIGDGWLDRQEFVDGLLGKKKIGKLNVATSKLTHAPCEGKVRVVSVNSIDMTYLKPLHDAIYDHLSGTDWCLRGEARTGSFREFGLKEGEIFVSGDYESATDNLSLDVASACLETILSSATRVPGEVRRAGMSTLGGFLELKGSCTVVRRGQLMGNSLSFPLLCLQNYLAFKWFVPRNVPVRINGDDIVFRCRQEEWEAWSAGVNSCGLRLSLGKTLIEKNFFSLNSTFFKAGLSGVKLCPVIRSTVFERGLDDLTGISGRLTTFQSFPREIRTILRTDLLKTFKKSVEWSQRSVRRGLGGKVCWDSLFRSRLLEREFFYLSLPKEAPIQSASVDGYTKTSLPEGWHRERSLLPINKDDQREFSKLLVETAWSPPRSIPAKEQREGTICWSRDVNSRMVRLMSMPTRRRLWWFLYGRRLPCAKGWGLVRWVRTPDRKEEISSDPVVPTQTFIAPPSCLTGGVNVWSVE